MNNIEAAQLAYEKAKDLYYQMNEDGGCLDDLIRLAYKIARRYHVNAADIDI